MTCHVCGRENAAGTRFCVHCGAPLTAVRSEDRLTVEVVPRRTAVTAGGTAGAEVVVRNVGTIVEHVNLVLDGAVAVWSTVDPPALRIMPGGSATGRLSLSPPRNSSTPAGAHALIVSARRADTQEVAGHADALVDVAPFDLVAARIVPQHVTRWHRSQHRVELTNSGNAVADLALSATDPDDLLSFFRLPPAAQVPPGQPMALPLHVRARWRLVGGRPVDRPFTVVASSANGTSVTAGAVMRQRAVIRLPLLGILALIPALLSFGTLLLDGTMQ